MKYALPASVLLHVAIGASGLFAWSIAPSGPGATYIEVPLDIVELANETNIEEVIRPREAEPEPEDEPEDLVEEEGEDDPAPSEPEAEPEVEEIAAPPEPEATAEDEPEPPVQEPEEAEDEPEPETPPPPTRKTSQPKKSSDPLSSNEDLLDSVEDTKTRRERRNSDRALEDQEQQQRRGAGDRSANQATVLDYVKSYITQKGCWRSTQDLPDWESLDVTVQFRIDAKGFLLGQPRVIKSARPINSDPYMRAAAERAVRAISNCQPFPLADRDYDLWRNEDFNLTFDENF